MVSPGQLFGSSFSSSRVQAFSPVSAFRAWSLERCARSPPVGPAISTSPARMGGEVKLQPWQVLGSVSFTFQSSLPVFWSSAIRWPSEAPMKTLPRPTVTPRL